MNLATVNFEEYIARMENMTDKVTVLDHLPEEGLILDYGCANGALASYVSPDRYRGFDISSEMTARAASDNPGYIFTHDFKELQKSEYSAIVFSSLLHEVYSYNNFSFQAVVHLLKEVSSLLSANGIIIIRDGIQPPGGEKLLELRLKNPKDAEAFLKHLLLTSPQKFPISILNGNLCGTQEAIVDFLNIYTWGWASCEREKYEKVNFATLEQWFSIFAESDLTVKEAHVISQNDYFKHLERLVYLSPKKWVTKAFFVVTPAKD